MQNFIIKNVVTKDLEAELEKIGFDIAYRAKATDKYRYKTIKIYNLSLPQANILKQTALSLGADCGIHREVLTSKIDSTDAILGGSFSQLKKICEKLEQQPFSLKILAKEIQKELAIKNSNTKLVGVINVTPDSFSDGGEFLSEKKAIEQIYKLIEDGADIIDIGAESTKPLSTPVTAEEQITRLKNVLKIVPSLNIPISIDTRSSEVAKFALDCGVKIINDTSGLSYDFKMANLISEYNATVIIQHSTQKTEDRPTYKDVVEEVYLHLLKKLDYAQQTGIKNIILDPGIGFGKSQEENFKILDRIEEFYSLKNPIMVGISRKSLLGITTNDNQLKDSLSAAISYPLIQKGVDYLRVHNVALHKQLLNLAR